MDIFNFLQENNNNIFVKMRLKYMRESPSNQPLKTNILKTGLMIESEKLSVY